MRPPEPAATPAPQIATKAPQPAAKPEPSASVPPAPPAPAPPDPAAAGPVVALPQTPVETHSYVREVPVAGGGSMRLDGIAFSQKPVALFGDKVVAAGESINGYTVVEIEAKRVKLLGPTGTVYVSLQ